MSARVLFTFGLISLAVAGGVAACSGGSSGPTTPNSTTNPTTPTSPTTPTTPTDTVHNICATVVAQNGSGNNGVPIGDVDCSFGWSNGPPISTCLNSPACSFSVGANTGTAPYVITMNIVSGFANKLTATLVNCPLGPQSQTSPCVPAKNESDGTAPFAVKLSFGPVGNSGPTTTLTMQQTGTSQVTGAQCSHLTWADATDILVADAYNNKVYLPIGGVLDGSLCANGTTAERRAAGTMP